MSCSCNLSKVSIRSFSKKKGTNFPISLRRKKNIIQSRIERIKYSPPTPNKIRGLLLILESSSIAIPIKRGFTVSAIAVMKISNEIRTMLFLNGATLLTNLTSSSRSEYSRFCSSSIIPA
ncbi:hypothetical protein ES708_14092 [subsurface metagenome]